MFERSDRRSEELLHSMEVPPLPAADEPYCLCVDLDGSLVKTDTLWESVWYAIRSTPWKFLRACLTLLDGRAAFKRRLAEIAPIHVQQLPYRDELVAWLAAQARSGRRVILATAATQLIAQRVAEHLAFFTDVVGSDGKTNCKGAAKLSAIQRIAPAYVYVGDSKADLPIWKSSKAAIMIGGKRKIRRTLKNLGVPILLEIPAGPPLYQQLARALRIQQWTKNILVFLPMFLGHRLTTYEAWKHGLLAFTAFCVVSSIVYVLNDLLDLDADRLHPVKRNRPFASGNLSIRTGLIILPILSIVAAGLIINLHPMAGFWLSVYFAAGGLYSLYLKTRLLVDSVALSMLYVLRILTGGAATEITISPWTLGFSLFLFFSVALVKRFGELKALPSSSATPKRRAYAAGDLPVVAGLGITSGVLSVVVFALYIGSPDVRMNYCSPSWLWLACPVALYWVGRLWILANRDAIGEDPMVFIFRDRISYLSGACILGIWLAASICW